MNILVFNCGSSSLTFALYALDADECMEEVLRGKASRVGVKGDQQSSIHFCQAGQKTGREVRLDSHRQAAGLVFDEIEARGMKVEAIGHRWPHGCGQFTTTLLDAALMSVLRNLVPLIPLHHPAILRVIEACRRRYPSIPQYVTTDTAFHATLPQEAYQYVLPRAS